MSTNDDDRPRGTRSKKKKNQGGGSKTLLIVGCIGCGGLTAVGGIAGAALFAIFVWPFADSPTKKKTDGGPIANNGGLIDKIRPAQVSIADIEKIEFGMTKGEVEAILGAGAAVSDADVARFQDNEGHSKVNNDWKKAAKDSQTKSWAEWRSGKEVIHIGFRQTRVGDLAALKLGVFSSAKIPGATEYHIDSVPSAIDLAAKREAKARAEKLFADPKWAKGAEVRQLFVGRWNATLKGAAPFEFAADGSVKTKDFTAKDMNGRYQFLADDQVKISLPSIFLKGQMSDVTYKVLITQDELMLAPQNGNSFVAGELFRRAKGPAKK